MSVQTHRALRRSILSHSLAETRNYMLEAINEGYPQAMLAHAREQLSTLETEAAAYGWTKTDLTTWDAILGRWKAAEA